MNDDNSLIHKYYAIFLSSRHNEDVSSGSEYVPTKQKFRRNKKLILDLLLNKSNIFEC